MVHSGDVPRLVTAGLWLLFTAVAVLTGLGAVAIVRGAVTGNAPAPLSAEQVSEQLRTGSVAPAPTATGPGHPRPSTTPTPSGSQSTQPHSSPSHSVTSTTPAPPPTAGGQTAAVVRTLGSRGGTVVAVCSDDRTYLRSWSPAAGYVVDEYARGPASEAEITFASLGTKEAEVKLTVTCERGRPLAQVETNGESDTSHG